MMARLRLGLPHTGRHTLTPVPSVQRRERETEQTERGRTKRAALDLGDTPLALLERAVDAEVTRLTAVLQSVRDAETALRREQEEAHVAKPLVLPSRICLDVGGTK